MNEKKIYPLSIIIDPYDGRFSGGLYLAFNRVPYDIPKPVFGNEYDCWTFWKTNSEKVGRGDSAEEAEYDLRMKLTDRHYLSPRMCKPLQFEQSVACTEEYWLTEDFEHYVETPRSIRGNIKQLRVLADDLIVLMGKVEIAEQINLRHVLSLDLYDLYTKRPDAYVLCAELDFTTIGYSKPIKVMIPPFVEDVRLAHEPMSKSEDRFVNITLDVLDALGYEFGGYGANSFTHSAHAPGRSFLQELDRAGLCMFRVRRYGPSSCAIYVTLSKEEATRRNVYQNRLRD